MVVRRSRAQGGTWVSNITETSPLFEYKDQLKLLFLPAAPPSPPAPPCPPNMPGVELTISWAFFVAFFLLSIINTIFFPVTLYVAISGWIRGRKVDEVAKRSAPPPGKYPPVCALVPCFLPNEKGIIMGTLNHILTEITYPGELVVMVVYNTPESMPMEAELRALERETFDRGRRVRVMRVLESRSKAENLNEAIKVVPQPLVAIYDADHYPDPESLTLLVDKLQETGADAVQGSGTSGTFGTARARALVPRAVHQRRVLLSVLHLFPDDGDPLDHRRLRRLERAVARLSHPRLRVLDVDADRGHRRLGASHP